ncbi:MAG TPA: S9 family peptidase [Puia sp.]|jgi:dipeptidyl aminopeptidase/acylaminoacyl peptidase
MKRPILFLLFLLTVSASYAQSGKEPVKVTDLLKIKSIGDIKLNKEGTQAACVVTSIEPDTDLKASKWDYKYITRIYLTPTDGSLPPRQLTTKENASQPAWSPDGKQLAFVRPVDGRSQIFLLSFDGGEPIQFTHFRYGAFSPKWSPDGKEILFASRISLKELIKDSLLNPHHTLPAWPFEKPGTDNNTALHPTTVTADPDGNPDEIRAWLDNNVADRKAKVLTKLSFQDEMEVSADLSFGQWFIQSVQTGGTPVPVTSGFYSYNNVDYTPDGSHLLITAEIDSSEHPDRVLESRIYIADHDGKHLHLLLGEKGKVYNNAKLSPSGKFIAFQVAPASFVTVSQLAIADFAALSHDGGSQTARTIVPIDRSTGNYVWSADEQYLYFTAQSNGGIPIYRVAAGDAKASGKPQQLSDFNSGTGGFDLKNDYLVFSRTEVADPSELYSANAGLQGVKKISSLNSDWISLKKLSLPEKHEFKNDIGETIEYWVMKPANYTPGRKYPLLLDIHGGPSAMWGPGEASMWHEFQFFCSKGYGVVYCNPRGSGGYGRDFLRANVGNWGTGPTGDVLTALDKTVAEGWADTSRLVVSGGSYAGYLVAWIVGHDHRFKAACAQRGVYDLATFFGEGNAWRLVPEYFGGYPWESATQQLLQHESPITYVANITTPLIIFHGENDRRTGFVQGEMLYRSLKVLGRPVEYIRHPGATHELTRSGDNRQRMDQMLRTYEFFQRWIVSK